MRNINRIILFLLFMQLSVAQQNVKDEINTLLNEWHQAATDANFEAYFDKMTSDGIFIGTDATENWNQEGFKKFSKPYFDKGKAWDFKTLERNIYINDKIAWFDELLETQMKICRGSGVLVKTINGWKVKHYVLSITIPNKNVMEVTKIKTNFDNQLISKLKK